MDDRFTRGMIAGFLAWMPTLVINLTLRYLQFSKLMYLDFSSIIIYGHRPEGALERYFALLITIFFMSLLGAVFAYLLKALTPKYYLFKGLVFGAGVWFITYAVTLLYRVPELRVITAGTAISNFAGAIIYGMSLAYLVVRLDQKKERTIL